MAAAVMKLKGLKFSQFWIVVVIFILMFLTFSVFLPGFLTKLNLIALLQNVSILGILGLSMAIIVIGRGIDLSTVSMLAVPPGLVLQMVQDGHSVPMAFLAALGLVILFSLIVGWFVAYAEVPSLYTTLGAGIFLAGLGQSAFFTLDVVQWSPQLDVIAWVGRGDLLGVPKPVFMFALAVLAIAVFLKKTKIGNFIYAVGDNPHAARTAGIPTRPTIVFQYVLAGLIAAFGGIVMAASISSMPTRIYNSTLIYDVILVVVLGGIGLSGGRGGVPNVILGTVFIGTLINGMTILNISYSAQNIIKGIVLLIALLVDTRINPRNEETAQQGDV